ncbi:glycosyltransferase family 2 protein [Silvibacterium acidisoli]|uniref:glycosyltransferase family 2 protein n=1 Tax=Acidobacteriaceae bacterium ZG23-2 TaxID=2883246 RepID=UPI00406BEF02
MGTLITVGIPVYNAMPYLPESVESLLSQSSSAFEILAIVDGATDGSLDYLQSIRDPRLRVLTQPNLGITRTLNRMLSECRTPWLMRQDADDISHPQRVAKTIEAIHLHPQAGMFYSLANYHPRHRAVGSFRCSRGSPEDLRAIVRSGYLLAICHPTATLNVQKTTMLGGYRLGLHNEDADLWWRLALEHDIHCIPEELVGFRQNPASVSTLNLAGQFVAGLYVQYLLLSHLWKRTPRALGEIRGHLEHLSPAGHFLAKQWLRDFNMHMAEGRHALAAAAFLAAIGTSPRYVWDRTKDELFSSRPIANGIQPQRFLELDKAIWG